MLICARCGEHCHRFRWFSELRRQGARGEWRSWERDPENPRLYWTRHCWPSCRANNVFTLFEQVEGFILAARRRLMPIVFGRAPPRSRSGGVWKCLPTNVAVDWPSTPSPWECKCGAVWVLADPEGQEDVRAPALDEQRGPTEIDATVLLPQLADLSNPELEALAQLVGLEQSRRTSPQVETAHPPPQVSEKEGSPVTFCRLRRRASSEAEGSKEGGSPPPTREVASRPAMAYIAQWGKVWHADTDCKHLYYKGERRSHIREVALAEVRRLTGFPPCKDCSAAWAGALPSPRALKIKGAQQ